MNARKIIVPAYLVPFACFVVGIVIALLLFGATLVIPGRSLPALGDASASAWAEENARKNRSSLSSPMCGSSFFIFFLVPGIALHWRMAYENPRRGTSTGLL
jgi:hypothetical protein